MPSGNKFRLHFERVDDTTLLDEFNCGLDVMDRFIHSKLQWCIDYHYCVVYAVKESDEIVAIVALGCDKLELDISDKEELQMGIFPKPDIDFNYQETFWAKSSYPAIEITYLAVRKDKRHLGIGEYVIEAIAQRAIDSRFNMAGCQFLTVEAYSRGANSAVGFYDKCDFVAAEEPNPNKETLRMYKTILPVVKYDDEEE
jgi:GNAT superfamily N-acetyltransferase